VGDAITGVYDGADLFTLGIGGKRGYVVLDGTFDISSGDCQLCHVFVFLP
jgi:predicted oxidoreductase